MKTFSFVLGTHMHVHVYSENNFKEVSKNPTKTHFCVFLVTKHAM